MINLNASDFPYDQWDTLHYDYWELFPFPNYFTLEEMEVINQVLQKMGVDPADEHLIEFRARPSDMKHLVAQVLRTIMSISQ